MQASRLIPLLPVGEAPLDLLGRCGGFYACPRSNGQRTGPLVGYAGRYESEDGSSMQYVGEVYANFAAAEPYPHVMWYVAELMWRMYSGFFHGQDVHVFCGAPIGGYSFSDVLARVCDRKVVKAEKKVVALATGTSRERADLVFGRHRVDPGEGVVIVEDVCNNFSTTEKLIRLIQECGATVVRIACLLNRSLYVEGAYFSETLGRRVPVLALVRRRIEEYRQDDLFVYDDAAAGNVVWKPKDEWEKLPR